MGIHEPGGARHDVLLAGQPLLAEGLRLLLADDSRTTVTGTVEDPAELPGVVGRQHPDVCVLHSALAGGAGDLAALIRSLTEAGRVQTPVLVLDDGCAATLIVGALEAGAAAVLDAADVRGTLVPAICAVAGGLTVCGPGPRAALLGSLPPRVSNGGLGTAGRGLAELTSRELEVLELVAAGLSNAGVAERLVLCETTVKSHVTACSPSWAPATARNW